MKVRSEKLSRSENYSSRLYILINAKLNGEIRENYLRLVLYKPIFFWCEIKNFKINSQGPRINQRKMGLLSLNSVIE